MVKKLWECIIKLQMTNQIEFGIETVTNKKDDELYVK